MAQKKLFVPSLTSASPMEEVEKDNEVHGDVTSSEAMHDCEDQDGFVEVTGREDEGTIEQDGDEV